MGRDVPCVVCGKAFVQYRSTGKFCSNACQKRAQYYRDIEATRARARIRRVANPLVIERNRKYQGEWRKKNRERLRIYSRAWYARNADRERLRTRYKKYGISAEQFIAMKASQNGLCAICRVSPVTDVDHDHRTFRVRSLLCNKCNVGLGSFNDDPELLESAAGYLREHRDRVAPGV